MINNKRNLRKITYGEIALLILSMFASMYIISSTDTVSAEGTETLPEGISKSTCIEMSNGAVCQEGIAETQANECPGGWIPTSKEQVTECEEGCCYDENTGTFSTRTTKTLCENNGARWNNDPTCTNTQETKLGCCILGEETEYVTNKECELLTKSRGLEKDYRNVGSENECLLLSHLQERGACVIGKGEEILCSHKTLQECNSVRGQFFNGMMCSNEEINSGCERQASSGCVEGKEGIYWYDSCGNTENIYSTNKEESWNNGRFLNEYQSCNPTSDNAESTSCGNCNRLIGGGSVCGINNEGTATCLPLDCKSALDTKGTKDRKNLESWCVYESQIGKGTSTVGSNHYVYSCNEGIVTSSTCGDYRTGICTENTITQEVSNEEFSVARCRTNMALQCLGNNQEGEDITKCEENPDCYLENFDYGKGYEFQLCLPRYSLGLKKNTEGEILSAQSYCNQANFKCQKVRVKTLFSGWETKAGNNCLDESFTEAMNNWCTSLGDCGAGVNVEERITTEGYTITGAPKLGSNYLQRIIGLASPLGGESIEAKDISGVVSNSIGRIENPPEGISYEEEDIEWMGSIVQGAGAVGTLAEAFALIGIDTALGNIAMTFGSSLSSVSTTLGTTPILGALSTLAIGITLGNLMGSLAAKVFGLGGEAAKIVQITGTLAGTFVAVDVLVAQAAVVSEAVGGAGAASGGAASGGGILSSTGGITMLPLYGVVLIAIAVIIIVAVVLKLLGIGKVKKTTAVFTCEPWQAPPGGTDCHLCDKNSLIPCTNYRCESLGDSCRLINEGTKEQSCVDISPNDNTVPTITPYEEALTKGYKIETTSKGMMIRMEDNSCIPENTPVIIGIKTNEYTRCKMAMEPGKDYENINEYYGNSMKRMNHSQELFMPSAESIAYEIADNLENPEEMSIEIIKQRINEQYNDYNIFIRCQDESGNANFDDYIINTCIEPRPDSKAPTISKSLPSDGSAVAYGSKEKIVKYWIDEPAECKWSNTEKTDYEDMTNSMRCSTSIEEREIYGWPCTANLTINNETNNYYIKCKDQPWLEGHENAENKRIISNDIKYTLSTTTTPLTITEITPTDSSTIYGGVEPISITLKTRTDGGIAGGISTCKYSLNSGSYIFMKTTNSNSHEQIFDLMTRGDKEISIKCEDNAGNIAEKKTNFRIELDTTPPAITRAYKNNNGITIITDENSECAYTKNTCTYDFVDGTRIGGTEKAHTLIPGEGDTGTYYIRCQDKFNNPRTGCTIILRDY